ncbi:MAG: 3-hydroxyacyl-CoA dehydrogenase family protein, partial [Acidobacteria bacterium]|nr:3-hydroxyacyl-CoA dehydrogenase family protein [Acidobacteriota bacterium]
MTTVGIIGAGTMGAEIAHVASVVGMDVLVADADLDRAEQGVDRARAIGARRVERGRLEPAAADEAAGRVRAVAGIDDLADVDVVIEAVPEDLALKTAVHRRIDDVVRPDALVATNTSGLSVTALG